MRCSCAGRSLAVALTLLAQGATADTLSVTTADGPLFSMTVAEGTGWCLSWKHSVTGGAVADCFVNRGGRMVLDRSYLHDTAAGLGEVPGRGVMRAAKGGGYWIEDMAEAVPGNTLPLRVGQPSTDHVITIVRSEWHLSEVVPGQRVMLRLEP